MAPNTNITSLLLPCRSQVNKKEGQEYTIPEAQGLQQCKDIVMTHCLASWSVETYDWIKLANYSASNKEEFCR